MVVGGGRVGGCWWECGSVGGLESLRVGGVGGVGVWKGGVEEGWEGGRVEGAGSGKMNACKLRLSDELGEQWTPEVGVEPTTVRLRRQGACWARRAGLDEVVGSTRALRTKLVTIPTSRPKRDRPHRPRSANMLWA